MDCPPVREIIHELVDYLLVQADKPWYYLHNTCSMSLPVHDTGKDIAITPLSVSASVSASGSCRRPTLLW